MPRKYHEARYRLEATVPLELLSKINKLSQERRTAVSRTVELLLGLGLEYYYSKQDEDKFKQDLEEVKEMQRILRTVKQ